jgi:hypothetical protein
MLAKLADIKARLQKTGTTEDALLTSLLAGVSSACETYADRGLMYVAETVEEYDGDGPELNLRRWPVHEVESVIEEADGEFDDAALADELDEGDDYRVDARRGKLLRKPDGMRWLCGRNTVQVTYSAGYTDPNDDTPPVANAAPPASLQHAVVSQCVHEYQRRMQPGAISFAAPNPGGNVSFTGEVELLRSLRSVLDNLRRWPT